MRTDSPDAVGLRIQQVDDAGAVRRTLVSPFSLSEGRIVEDETETVQAKARAGSPASAGRAAMAKVETTLRRRGMPLPRTTRTFMEDRFGHDFSGVRIHADASATEAARSVNARAFVKGENIVFDHGQYAPQSRAGTRLLAHELTHVIQQGRARERTEDDSPAAIRRSGPKIGDDPDPSVVRRIKWNTARDTGSDSYPWGSGPKGDVYKVETDAGTKIPIWKPHDGRTYWCHSYAFGGWKASGGPFSIWGQQVRTVLADDGWQREYSCVARRPDILVFGATRVAHSGIVHTANAPSGTVDENTSMLDSKWGQAPLNRSSWLVNAGQYGQYEVFSKEPLYGPCSGKGANER
jgi:hypothetical protein